MKFLNDWFYEWVDHDGKGNPALEPKKRVAVLFRHENSPCPEVEPWDYWVSDEEDCRNYWIADGGPNDIIRYAVVKEDKYQ